jgi:hypothetical protein
MKYRIEIDAKTRKKIRETMGVCGGYIDMANSWRRNSKLCYAIRVMSMENGGRLINTEAVQDWTMDMLK